MNVSVIVATYGDGKWAKLARERAAPSVRAQGQHAFTYHNGEVDSLALVRNRAVLFTTGDWLCFLDADDELEPGYFDAMRAADFDVADYYRATGSGPILLVPMVRRVSNHWRLPDAAIPNKGQWPKVNECVIGTLVPRSLFNEVGGFRDHTDDGTPIDLYEDWDLWLRCHDAGAALWYTGAVYREHVNPTGRNNSPTSKVTYDAIWADHVARTGNA